MNCGQQNSSTDSSSPCREIKKGTKKNGGNSKSTRNGHTKGFGSLSGSPVDQGGFFRYPSPVDIYNQNSFMNSLFAPALYPPILGSPDFMYYPYADPLFMNPSLAMPPRQPRNSYSSNASSDKSSSDKTSDVLTSDMSHLALRHKKSDDVTSRGTSSASNSSPRLSSSRQSLLPSWALDKQGAMISDITLAQIVDSGDLVKFAIDKAGCCFLQKTLSPELMASDKKMSERIFVEALEDRTVFLMLCRHTFGNFFAQRVLECGPSSKLQVMVRDHLIKDDIADLCLDKSACRVLQTALQKLEPSLAESLVDRIPRDHHLIRICTNQNANHVIQKIIKSMPLKKWSFIVDYFARGDSGNLMDVCEDKYGCRVVQTIVEVLSGTCKDDKYRAQTSSERTERARALHKLMGRIIQQCPKLASNEFANYVVQYILSSRGMLDDYRNEIIEKCILRNLLSMAQEKFASHVVECALKNAPVRLLADMMDEVFDGYVPHPETGKDALDILLFHQFGNYVVQGMLKICCQAVLGERETTIRGKDFYPKYEEWLRRLHMRVFKEQHRLKRFSSGKKIIEQLQELKARRGEPSLLAPPLSSADTTTCSRSSHDIDHFAFKFHS